MKFYVWFADHNSIHIMCIGLNAQLSKKKVFKNEMLSLPKLIRLVYSLCHWLCFALYDFNHIRWISEYSLIWVYLNFI